MTFLKDTIWSLLDLCKKCETKPTVRHFPSNKNGAEFYNFKVSIPRDAINQFFDRYFRNLHIEMMVTSSTANVEITVFSCDLEETGQYWEQLHYMYGVPLAGDQ